MNNLELEYARRRKNCLVHIAEHLEDFLKRVVKDYPRIDHISVRAKGVDRFVIKANKKIDDVPKYSDPLNQIVDQVAGRITTFYERDVDEISSLIQEYFSAIEIKEMEPDSNLEFGYFGKHFILPIPSDVLPEQSDSAPPEHFELQIKTLHQHAWSEASHDLDYKPEFGSLTNEQRRLIAYAAAQAWGADRIFSEIALERIFASLNEQNSKVN
ncbi:MAG: RelA/SpoT domain-containing protein [Pseudomonadota bacterium]